MKFWNFLNMIHLLGNLTYVKIATDISPSPQLQNTFVWGRGEERIHEIKVSPQHVASPTRTWWILFRAALCGAREPSFRHRLASETRAFSEELNFASEQSPTGPPGQFVSCWAHFKVVFCVVCLSPLNAMKQFTRAESLLCVLSLSCPLLAVSSIVWPLAWAVVLG